MYKKKGFLSAALLSALVLSACGGGDEEEGSEEENGGDTDISVVTGGEEGAYFPLGGALTNNIINEHVEGVNASNFSSGGSVTNIDDIDLGEADLAFVQNDIASYAAEGDVMFEEPIDSLQGIATLYPEVIQIITTADSGIESVSDLDGASVAVGDQGSGTEANAQQILEAHDITYDDISAEYMDFGDAANSLQDGNVDAAFITAGLPTGAVESLNASTDINVVSIEEDVVTELEDSYAYYTPFTIPADQYGLDSDAETVAVRAMLATSADMDEDLVYDITAAMFENTDVFADAHEQGGNVSLEDAQDGMSIDLHPGAQRYYDEQ